MLTVLVDRGISRRGVEHGGNEQGDRDDDRDRGRPGTRDGPPGVDLVHHGVRVFARARRLIAEVGQWRFTGGAGE
jgi:hypothetical protein